MPRFPRSPRLFAAATVVAFVAAALIPANAQVLPVPSGTFSVSAPASVTCSAPFSSSVTLTGVDVQGPGVADVVLVLDESGSIDSWEFELARFHAIDLVFMLTSGGARVGVAMFSDDARTVVNLSDNPSDVVNGLFSVSQRLGATCIGCGIQQGQTIFADSPPRPGATQVMIVVTAGQNNVNIGQFPDIVSAAKQAGIQVLSVGVGANVNTSEIEFMASDVPGVQTAFLTPDFWALSGIVDPLKAAIVSPGTTDVSVFVNVTPHFPATGASATAGTVSVTGSQVVWTLPALGAISQTLTIDHQHDGTVTGPLEVFWANYTDAEFPWLFSLDRPSTTVTGCNVAPVANAGHDESVPATGPMTAVALDGSGSTDDGLIEPLTYAWSSDTGIVAAGVAPVVMLPVGTHTFTLTVSDGEFSDADTVVVAVADTTPPVISGLPSDLSAGATSTSGAPVTWPSPAATDLVDGVVPVVCAPPSGAQFPVGTTAVTCTATDAAGNSSSGGFSVTVTDTTAPEIASVTPSTGMLWPPNHRMAPVSVSVAATDNVDAAPMCTITGVTSSEADNGRGDGNTTGDAVITGPLTVELRSERAGRGDGRTYTIEVTCTDAAGNASSATTVVTAPKSQGRGR